MSLHTSFYITVYILHSWSFYFINPSVDDPTSESISDNEVDENDADESSLASMSELTMFVTGKVDEEDESLRGPWKPLDSPLGLGDWEQHTRVGSK